MLAIKSVSTSTTDVILYIHITFKSEVKYVQDSWQVTADRKNNNVLFSRDSVILTFACEGTSIYAGLVIFTVLGFMANKFSIPIENIVKSGEKLRPISIFPNVQPFGIA